MKGRLFLSLMTILIVLPGTNVTIQEANAHLPLPRVIRNEGAGGPVWQIEVVDSNIGQGGSAEVSLALDSMGDPHVSYADWSVWPDMNLKYAHRAQTGWVTQTASASPAVEGFDSSLAVDSGNAPHIAYPNGNYDLLYSWWSGSQWSVRVIGSGPYFGSDPALALDGSNVPHISFYNGWPHYIGLRYTYWTGSNWDIQTVDGPGEVGSGNSLVLDTSGHPHVSYCDQTNGSVKYATWTGASWDIHTVEIVSGSCEKTSLGLDSDGNPHIAYAVRLPPGPGPTDYEVKYARWTGHYWEVQQVNQQGGLGISMDLDSNDIPHLSYLDETTGALLYAYRSGAGWHTQLVDDGPGPYVSDTSIGVGKPGAHIAYYKWTGPYPAPPELRYAHSPLTTVQAVILPSGGALTSTFDRTSYIFPPSTFTDTVIVTHTVRLPGGITYPGNNLAGIGHEFEVAAVYTSTGQLAQPTQPYTVTVQYTNAEKGVTIEDTLALYYWDGHQWVKGPSSVVDTVANTVTATPSHFSLWAVLGETRRVFLPLILRNY